MMNRVRISAGLMLISILFIAAFQFWWLRKTYKEEQQTLNMRTGILFRETVHWIQVSKLKIDSSVQKHIPSESDIVGTINMLKQRVRDSSDNMRYRHPEVMISINKHVPLTSLSGDTMLEKTMVEVDGNMKVFNVHIGTDSLKDSVRVSEVNTAFAKAL